MSLAIASARAGSGSGASIHFFGIGPDRVRPILKRHLLTHNRSRVGRKPSSVFDGHLSKRPTLGTREAGHLSLDIWPCSRWGLPSVLRCRGTWCALTAPFHLCLCHRPSAVCFLWHFPWDHSPLPYDRHRTLRSSDFPLPVKGATICPTLQTIEYTTQPGSCQSVMQAMGSGINFSYSQ